MQYRSAQEVKQTKDLKDFWNDRAKRYGHTGYTDRYVYAFDQQARLYTVEHILADLSSDRRLALDFGCGCGDFANLLSRYFDEVIAFDISDAVVKIARAKYRACYNVRFITGNNITETDFPFGTADLVLSVTVLDHIVDNSQLLSTLGHFHRLLNSSGIVLALETALDYEMPKTFYKRFTSYDQWLTIFSECGFCLHECYGFYDPDDRPCGSYLLYRAAARGIAGLPARLFGNRIYYNPKLSNRYLSSLARRYLQTRKDCFSANGKAGSPVKIMMFTKRSV